MRDIYHDRLFVIIVLIVFATIPAPEAGAEDHTCKIRSELPQLFIIVYDVFPDGNPGKLIWQGVIKNGQQIEINAEFGRFFFRYKTKPESLDDLINGVNRFCRNGEILNLP